MLCEWLTRPHVREWWGPPGSLEEVVDYFLPMTEPDSSARGYIALLAGQPVGFIQSYKVAGCGGGWWEDETDPGARGIDQFLADPADLHQGLGSAMVRAFVDGLFNDPEVTRVQVDPAPQNLRAIRSYLRAGFETVGEVSTPDGAALLMVASRP